MRTGRTSFGWWWWGGGGWGLLPEYFLRETRLAGGGGGGGLELVHLFLSCKKVPLSHIHYGGYNFRVIHVASVWKGKQWCCLPEYQWRSQDFILGGGGGNMRASGASEGGVSPSHGREIFWKFVYKNGIFFHTKWHYVRWHMYQSHIYSPF